jgi:tRNA-dihydrouridine synthase
MEMSFTQFDAVQPDLLDINFGCPVKKVVCKGAGAILKDVDLMIRLTKKAVIKDKSSVTVLTFGLG